MRVKLALVLVAIAAAGCAPEARTRALADLNLSDPRVVEDVLSDLPADDRGAFSTFVVHHLATSKAFCGEVLLDEQGRQPTTVGEAIRLTRLREERLNAVPEVVNPDRLDPDARHQYELAALLEAHRRLVDSRETLMMVSGEKARDRVAQLDREIAVAAERLEQARAAGPAARQET
ncbi:hypothetical protein EYB45_07570 [Erythrobacteraceae bacterium CFH 75059]|uniref:hypothetical protein n=1 Tax=Qipengyuania thermophila TaxID=2509361 RepID=UPI0010216013|nr:hypothetical protein [Qipengyuania thermophila]TCD05328.1 hypothetical protein EYB45_07570 [Erythrobacteraceae bacterium CFH 75059]